MNCSLKPGWERRAGVGSAIGEFPYLSFTVFLGIPPREIVVMINAFICMIPMVQTDVAQIPSKLSLKVVLKS